MANALTFIESNFEELTPEEQLDVVHKQIRDMADKLKIPKIKELSKIPDLIALNIVRFVLENCDPAFKEWLEDHPDYFNTIVREEVCDKPAAKSMKWDDLIIRCEWKWSLEQLFEQDQTHKEVVMDLTKVYPLQFDAILAKEILNDGDITEDKIKEASVKKSEEWKTRLHKWRSDRLKKLFDH